MVEVLNQTKIIIGKGDSKLAGTMPLYVAKNMKL
jgi:hypothetical protein